MPEPTALEQAVTNAVAKRELAAEEAAYSRSLSRRSEALTTAVNAVWQHSPDNGPEYRILCEMGSDDREKHIAEWADKFMLAGHLIAEEELGGALEGGTGFLPVVLPIYRAALADDRGAVVQGLVDVSRLLLIISHGAVWSQFKNALGTVAESVCIAWNVRLKELSREHCTAIITEANKYESALTTAVGELTNYLGSYDAKPSTCHERFALAVGAISRMIPVLACQRDVGAERSHWSESDLNDRRELYRRILVDSFHLLREVVGHHLAETLLPTVTQEVNDLERSTFAILEWYDWDAQASDARVRLATLAHRWGPLLRSGKPPADSAAPQGSQIQEKKNDEKKVTPPNGPGSRMCFFWRGDSFSFSTASLRYKLCQALWDAERNAPFDERREETVLAAVYKEDSAQATEQNIRSLVREVNKAFDSKGWGLKIVRANDLIWLEISPI